MYTQAINQESCNTINYTFINIFEVLGNIKATLRFNELTVDNLQYLHLVIMIYL